MGYDYKNIMKFQKSQIGGLTKKLCSYRFNGKFDGSAVQETIDGAASFGLTVGYNDSNEPGEQFVFTKVRKITAEQTKFGKAWLKDFFYKKDGSPRGGKRTEYLDSDVLKIANKVSRFEFIGVFGAYSGSYRDFVQFLPIYRSYDRKGNYFDYAPMHWGQPLIFDVEYKREV